MQNAAQYANTAANLSALASSGQLSWMTSPIGMQVQQPWMGPVPTASSRRRAGQVGGFTLRIPTNLAGLVPGSSAPNGFPGALGPFGQFTPMGPEPVKINAIPLWFKSLKTYMSQPDIPIVKEGKIDVNKVIDTTIDPSKTQDLQKDKILPFTNKISTDQWAEVLCPEFGRITEDEPVPAAYPSPMHYVEAMKIASLSSMPMNLGGMGQTSSTPCDDARATLASLATQPHASIIKSVAASCPADTKDWYKVETARGRFWFYLWLGLWAKYAQNPKYAGALYGTGNKMLTYYDADAEYGNGNVQSVTGTDAAGFLLSIIRGIVAAGWTSSRSNPINPGYVFEKWVKPIIANSYGDDSTQK